MSEFDEIALNGARTALAQMPGVTVLNEWQKIPNSAVWMLRLRLELLGVEPTSVVPQITEWEVVVNFEKDVWGKVQIHPALGEHGISHSFSHQRFNGGPHPEWPCRNGFLCTPTSLSLLAKNRGAVQEEPTTTIERTIWHVARALEWLPMAATEQLVQHGDDFELPDFEDIAGGVYMVLAYYENQTSYKCWQQQASRSGIAYLANFSKVYMTHHFMDAKDRQLVYQPAWGQLISGVSKKMLTQALWIRLDEIPVVNTYQVPTTVSELQLALAKEGKDLHELLDPLWASYHLGKEANAFLLVGMPVVKRVGELPERYHWQMIELIPPAALKFPKMNKEILKRRVAEPTSPLRWIRRVENWHPEDLQNRGRLTPALCHARILLLGAGALGSQLADQLVRMGVQHLTIVDGDAFEAGNLVRHELTLDQLYEFKAKSLAKRLNLVNPSAWVAGIAKAIPTDSPEFTEAASEATLIIDATADDDVLRIMPLPEMNPEALFVSCSLSLRAEHLFFYANRTKDFDHADFDAWYKPFRTEQETQARQLEMPRGAGCWNPLTPAPLNRIAGLTGATVELLEQVYGKPVDLPVSLSYTWPVPSLVPAVEEITP